MAEAHDHSHEHDDHCHEHAGEHCAAADDPHHVRPRCLELALGKHFT